MWRSAHPRPVFAHAVLEAAHTVLREHGEAGYRAKWAMHPYPLGLILDLRRLHLVRGRRRHVIRRLSAKPDRRLGPGRISGPPPDRPGMAHPSRPPTSAWQRAPSDRSFPS